MVYFGAMVYLTMRGLPAGQDHRRREWRFARRLRPAHFPADRRADQHLGRAHARVEARHRLGRLARLCSDLDRQRIALDQPAGRGIAVLSSYSRDAEREQIDAIAPSDPRRHDAGPRFSCSRLRRRVVGCRVFTVARSTNRGVLLTSPSPCAGCRLDLWAATLSWILLRILNSTYRNTAGRSHPRSRPIARMPRVNLATVGIQATSGLGTLILGFGEAARAYTMLGGVMLALQLFPDECCSSSVSLLVPSAMLAVAAWMIDQAVSGSFERLLRGGVACTFCDSICRIASDAEPTQSCTSAHSTLGLAQDQKRPE